jgi:hypothetical protein
MAEALGTARAITVGATRIRALIDLASVGKDATLFDEALAAARAIGAPELRADLLAAAATALAAAQ